MVTKVRSATSSEDKANRTFSSALKVKSLSVEDEKEEKKVLFTKSSFNRNVHTTYQRTVATPWATSACGIFGDLFPLLEQKSTNYLATSCLKYHFLSIDFLLVKLLDKNNIALGVVRLYWSPAASGRITVVLIFSVISTIAHAIWLD